MLFLLYTDDVVNMFLWRFPIKCVHVHEITGINFVGSILSDDDDKHERTSYFMFLYGDLKLGVLIDIPSCMEGISCFKF